MSEMLEKVAQAIESEFRCNKNATPETMARAAAEALREPSEGMYRVADLAWDAAGADGKVMLFRAMIDNVLKES